MEETTTKQLGPSNSHFPSLQICWFYVVWFLHGLQWEVLPAIWQSRSQVKSNVIKNMFAFPGFYIVVPFAPFTRSFSMTTKSYGEVRIRWAPRRELPSTFSPHTHTHVRCHCKFSLGVKIKHKSDKSRIGKSTSIFCHFRFRLYNLPLAIIHPGRQSMKCWNSSFTSNQASQPVRIRPWIIGLSNTIFQFSIFAC